MTLLVLHEALCAAVWYTVFCRAVRSDHTVRLDVRLSFIALGLASALGMAAPLAWGWQPDWYTLVLLASITLVQGVTAAHWQAGVPDQFIKPECRPRRRRATDLTGRHHV